MKKMANMIKLETTNGEECNTTNNGNSFNTKIDV